MDTFLETLRDEIKRNMTANPERYRMAYPSSIERSADHLYGAMAIALAFGDYDQKSASIVSTCKRLGISATRKAINAAMAA